MTERRPQTEAELVELVRSIETRAPELLHRELSAMIASHGVRGRSSRVRALALIARGAVGTPRLAAAAGVLAAIVVAIVLSLGGAARSGPSLRETAALTLRAPTTTAPPESAASHAELVAAVEGVAFPYWQQR